MNDITDHRELIDALGGNKAVADEIPDCTPVRVGQWKLGNRIPVEYWSTIIELAKSKGLALIDSEWLMNTFRPRTNSTAPTPTEEAA